MFDNLVHGGGAAICKNSILQMLHLWQSRWGSESGPRAVLWDIQENSEHQEPLDEHIPVINLF